MGSSALRAPADAGAPAGAPTPASLYTRARLALEHFGHGRVPELAQLSEGAVYYLLHRLAKGPSYVCYRERDAIELGKSKRTISEWRAELRKCVVGGALLLESRIAVPLHGEMPWRAGDRMASGARANLHGDTFAAAELLDAIDRAKVDVRAKRLDEAKAHAEARELRDRERAERPPRPRRPMGAPPRIGTWAESDVQGLCEAWDALGLRNRDGTPSVTGESERRTLRARLRAGRELHDLWAAVAGAGADDWMRKGRAASAFAVVFAERNGALDRFAHQGRKLLDVDVADPPKDVRTSLQKSATTLSESLPSPDITASSPSRPPQRAEGSQMPPASRVASETPRAADAASSSRDARRPRERIASETPPAPDATSSSRNGPRADDGKKLGREGEHEADRIATLAELQTAIRSLESRDGPCQCPRCTSPRRRP